MSEQIYHANIYDEMVAAIREVKKAVDADKTNDVRDEFVKAAIHSINWNQFNGGFPEAAKAAYLFANALLEERSKQ